MTLSGEVITEAILSALLGLMDGATIAGAALSVLDSVRITRLSLSRVFSARGSPLPTANFPTFVPIVISACFTSADHRAKTSSAASETNLPAKAAPRRKSGPPRRRPTVITAIVTTAPSAIPTASGVVIFDHASPMESVQLCALARAESSGADCLSAVIISVMSGNAIRQSRCSIVALK